MSSSTHLVLGSFLFFVALLILQKAYLWNFQTKILVLQKYNKEVDLEKKKKKPNYLLKMKAAPYPPPEIQ